MRAFLPLLRTRLGLAALLATLVVLIVTGFRLFGGGSMTFPNARGQNPTAVVSHEPDDGLATQPAAPQPSVASGERGPLQVAEAFAARWIRADLDSGPWLEALRPHATKHLQEELSGVDPESVPARKVTGPARLIPRSESFAEVEIPLDAGTLRLRMLGPEGHWFVDGVDWSRE